VQPGDFLVVEADRAGGRVEQARQAGQQRGLAAAGRAEQHDQLAVVALAGEIVERSDLVSAGREFNGEVLKRETSHHPLNAMAGSAPVTRRSATHGRSKIIM
jgi:hypothetical protein